MEFRCRLGTAGGEIIEAVYVADSEGFGAALLHATGPPEHLEQLKTRAEKKGMRLASDGLRRGRNVVAAKEADNDVVSENKE